jgi:tetraacyldisaccharide 4'-kinase
MPGNAGSSTDSPKAGEHSGLDSLWGRRGYVFSGIARNERFQRTIEQAGGQVCGTSFFDDHHWYTGEELAEIMRSAADKGAELIITTEKDFARIPMRYHGRWI